MDLLQHTSDLEAFQVEHNLSSMLMNIHLSRHTSLLDQLLQHSDTLLGVLTRHRENGAGPQDDELSQRYRELEDKQKRLAAEVTELKGVPVQDGDRVSYTATVRTWVSLVPRQWWAGLPWPPQMYTVALSKLCSSHGVESPSYATARHSIRVIKFSFFLFYSFLTYLGCQLNSTQQ